MSKANIDQKKLCDYAKEAANESTNKKLKALEFVENEKKKPDVAIFDFTTLHQVENASRVLERKGKRLLIGIVGDSLLQVKLIFNKGLIIIKINLILYVKPFWPQGTGIARGFLAAFDTAWMIRGLALNCNIYELLIQREAIYYLLPQTSPDNINKNFHQYSIDPATR